MPVVWRERLILVAPFLGVALLVLFAPSDDGPTVCPVALCTSTACPGCGMTRAAGYLIRGDLGSALTYHPLIPLIVFQLAVGWVWFLLRRAGKVEPLKNRTLNIFLVVTTLALVGVWVIRLATGSLPPV